MVLIISEIEFEILQQNGVDILNLLPDYRQEIIISVRNHLMQGLTCLMIINLKAFMNNPSHVLPYILNCFVVNIL